MGYRTVVILDNDFGSTWCNDSNLGQKIAYDNLGTLGNVVEVVHADTQSLVLVDSFNYKVLTRSRGFSNENDNEVCINLLKEAAEKFGFKLVKN